MKFSLKYSLIYFISGKYMHSDYIGNPGLLHSPCIDSSTSFSSELSVKLCIHYDKNVPAYFTCTCKLDTININST